MYHRTSNYLSNYLLRFSGRRESVVCQGRCGRYLSSRCSRRPTSRRASSLAGLLLLTLTAHPILAQEKSPEPLKGINANIAVLRGQQQTPALPAKRSVTISDAVSIFLQQNLLLVAARYDIDTADAEKLTARLRPNPELSVGLADLPLNFSGNVVKEQQYSYVVSQTFELGGKRPKRINAANVNSDLARGQFQTVVWQLTNDLKRKFYAVLLTQSLLKLATENHNKFE
jgi:outer membrane protein TolC